MKQGEIWLVNLSPAIGAEIARTRSCVIISSNEIAILPPKVIAPITDYKRHHDSLPWMVELSPDHVNKLSKRSVIDLFQLRSVSQLRLIRKLGTITEMEFKKIFEALKAVFGFFDEVAGVQPDAPEIYTSVFEVWITYGTCSRQAS